LNNHQDILVFMRMIEKGIIPFDNLDSRISIDHAMLTMTPKERRRCKRKFRKLWRQALKSSASTPAELFSLKKSCGSGMGPVDVQHHHRVSRAIMVYRLLLSQVLIEKD